MTFALSTIPPLFSAGGIDRPADATVGFVTSRTMRVVGPASTAAGGRSLDVEATGMEILSLVRGETKVGGRSRDFSFSPLTGGVFLASSSGRFIAISPLFGLVTGGGGGATIVGGAINLLDGVALVATPVVELLAPVTVSSPPIRTVDEGGVCIRPSAVLFSKSLLAALSFSKEEGGDWGKSTEGDAT